MPSVGHIKRVSRIGRRAIPEVRQAYEAGLISARRADVLLYMSPKRQAAALNALLTERQRRESQSRLVAITVETYLKALNGRKVDLAETRSKRTTRRSRW